MRRWRPARAGSRVVRLALAAVLLGGAVAADQPPSDDEPSSEAPPAAEDPGPDPCASPQDLGTSWTDWLASRLHHTVCQTAMWFDSYFGDDRALDEYRRSGGRASLHLIWTEHDGLDPRLRFRVDMRFPNLSDRFDAFIGRENRNEYLTDSADRVDAGSQLFEFEGDEDLLLGLGYTPLRGFGSRFRVSAGAKLDVLPEPWVKATYRYNYLFDDHTLFRWRQSLFWEVDEQLGTTTRLDLERKLGGRQLLRWANTGVLSGRSEGVEWWSSLILFSNITDRRALATTLWCHGETDAEVPVDEFGVRIVYRQRLHRDWLFVDVGPVVSWPRDHPGDPREPSFGVMIGGELLFGEKSW